MMWIFSVQNKSVNDLHVKYISNLFSTRHHITKTVAINFFIVLRIKRGSVVHSFICCSPHGEIFFQDLSQHQFVIPFYIKYISLTELQYCDIMTFF